MRNLSALKSALKRNTAALLALACLAGIAVRPARAEENSCPEIADGLRAHTWTEAGETVLPHFSDSPKLAFGNPGEARACTVCGKVQTFKTSGDWVYALRDDGTAEIVRCNQPEEVEHAAVPETVDGIAVTAIGDRAFAECYYLTEVVLPQGITAIGSFAFYGCTGLERLTVPASVVSVGRNPFLGAAVELSLAGGSQTLEYTNGCLIDRQQKRLIAYTRGPAQEQEEDALLSVTVPAGTLEIGDYAFSRTDVEQVTLPDGIRKIGANAFERCARLSALELPEGTQEIGEFAFLKCRELKQVNLPDSVASIGRGLFAGSPVEVSVSPSHAYLEVEDNVIFERKTRTLLSFPYLSSDIYTIPADVREIGEYAFAYCRNLTEIEIPNTVLEINDYAFYRCEKLAYVELPDSITQIKSGTFFGCRRLETVVIPDSVTEICEKAFDSCQAMDSVAIPASVRTLDEGAFQGCLGLREVVVPGSVASLPVAVFDACIRLERVELESGITKVDDFAFYDCEALREVLLPDTLTEIGRYAFYRCMELEQLTLPGDVELAGEEIFGKIPSLTVTGKEDSSAAAYCASYGIAFQAEK